MAVSGQHVTSPDGRTWSVTTSRRRRGLRESGKAPFLVANVIATTILLVVFLVILRSDVFKILSLAFVVVFLLWLGSFLNSLFRVTITADTQGPPPAHRKWVVVKRGGRNRAVREVEEAIKAGQDAREPQGTRLEEI